MNKASRLASGKWINYMNCGDTFCNNDVITKIRFNDFSNYVMLYEMPGYLMATETFLKFKNHLK